MCRGALTFPPSHSRGRAGFRAVRARWESLPPLQEEIFFPAAVFANVSPVSCPKGDAGVVSLNLSHCPSCWKPVEHSKLEIHFMIYPGTPPETDPDCPSSSWHNQTEAGVPALLPVPQAPARTLLPLRALAVPWLCPATWKCCSIKPSHLPQPWDGSESPGKRLVAWQSYSGRRKAPC